MKLMFFTLSLMLCATQAWAAYDDSPHSISAALGFAAPGSNALSGTASNGQPGIVSFNLSGLLGLGADYDYAKSKDISFGGFLRYYSVSSTVGNVTFKNTMLALGPDIKGYISNDIWMGYMGAGIEYLAPSYSGTVGAANGDVTITSGLGLMMSMGLLYKFSSTMAFGLESMRLIGMCNSINGAPIQDFMLKARFQL